MVTRSEQRWQAILLCYRMILLAACGFCWLSLLSFDAADWPSPKAWPHPFPPSNLCGPTGAWLAYHLFYWIGSGSYVLALYATIATLAVMARGRITDPWLRALGAACLAASLASFVRMFAPGGPGALPHGNGGIVGIAIVHGLCLHCSRAGTALILIVVVIVGALLAVEGLAIVVPVTMGKLGRRTAALAGNAGYALVDMTGQALATATAPRERTRPAPPPHRQPDPPEEDEDLDEPNVPVDDAIDRPDAHPRRRRFRLLPAGWLRLPRIDWGRGRKADPDDKMAPGVEDRHTPDAPSGEREGPIINPPPIQLDALSDEHTWDAASAAEAAVDRSADEEPIDEDVEDDADIDDDEDATGEDEAETYAESAAPGDDEELDPDDLKGSLAGNGTVPVVRAGKRQAAKAEASPYPKALAGYQLPPLRFLEEPEYGYIMQQESVVREKAKILERTLSEFRLDTRVVEIDTGPVITMYELDLSPGIKVSRIVSLSSDIARALKAPSVRVVAPLPGKNTIGIEVPNIDKENVRFKELLTMTGGKPGKMQLPLFLGKDASGTPLISDLAKMPHMLIAGTTGSGKSVCMNSIVMSVLMTQRPNAVKLILVDPKMVEMSLFKDVPHLMCPIVTDMSRAEMILDWAATKMDERYELLAEAGVRNIAGYNKLTREELDDIFQPASEDEWARIPMPLPHIIIMIDELADLMMISAKEVEHHLSRLAQKSRAVGIHIVVATQRPEAKVVTGLIKSNLPCRVAFRVASRMDSRIVLDQNGAEVLMGQGDMLFLPPGTSKLVRAQGTFVSDEELKSTIAFLAEQTEPEFHPELMKLGSAASSGTGERDPLFNQAARIIIESGRGSVSLLQRRLTVGYGRASRLVDQMAAAGVVGPYKGSQAREVLITLDEWDDLETDPLTTDDELEDIPESEYEDE